MDCVKFVEYGEYTGEPICVCGSSQADQSYAKRFWQSMELVPPLESRLVSGSNVKQRLKSAPLVGTPVACLSLTDGVEEPEEFLQLQAKAFENKRLEAISQLERFAYLREMDLQRLENARQCRLEMERRVIPAKQLNYRKANTSLTSSHQLQKRMTSNKEEAAIAIADIIHFETCILHKSDTCPVLEFPDL